MRFYIPVFSIILSGCGAVSASLGDYGRALCTRNSDHDSLARCSVGEYSIDTRDVTSPTSLYLRADTLYPRNWPSNEEIVSAVQDTSGKMRKCAMKQSHEKAASECRTAVVACKLSARASRVVAGVLEEKGDIVQAAAFRRDAKRSGIIAGRYSQIARKHVGRVRKVSKMHPDRISERAAVKALTMAAEDIRKARQKVKNAHALLEAAKEQGYE